MILKLSFKDLRHDWLLSICLILTIASIVAPLLILFGLKSGTIQTLRGRLIEDPKNREIRPVTTQPFQQKWFKEIMAANREISFVVPMTRQISTSVTARTSAGVKSRIALLATAKGDPLLLDNGVTIPPENSSTVLTAPAAEALKVAIGDTITLSVNRTRRGRTEKGEIQVTVTGILQQRASGLKSGFVTLNVIEAVEDYKDGRAVPAYGWTGELPVAYPVFDGVAVFTPNPLGKLEEILLTNNTGFSASKKIAADKAAAVFGYPLSPGWNGYLISVKKRAATEESVKAVQNKLRGRGAVIIPWIKPLDIVLTAGNREKISLRLFSITDKVEMVSPLRTDTLFMSSVDKTGQPGRLLVSDETGLPDGKVNLALTFEQRQLALPTSLVKSGSFPGTAYAGASFAGMLNLLRYRNVRYDNTTDSLLLARRGYAGFRMYAATIDDVATIEQYLEKQGIAVHTEKERIGEVRRLDSYMTLIFWLIATVGLIGGIAALTASLYASVERKKKELNILRLLGLLKRQIILFPVFQGLLLSGGGLLLAAAVFWIVAQVINRLFSSQLQATESLCTLSVTHGVILVIGICICAVVSATLAALQATRLDPAEALRDE